MTGDLFPDDLKLAADNDDAQNTPADLCADLGVFDLDVASNPRSVINAARSYCLERGEDGLALPWVGSVWCNGPYSDPLPWCERLARHTSPWAALWKLDPTTTWFAVMMKACDGYGMFRKRLRFSKAGNTGVANFASVLFWGGGWRPPEAIVARLWPPTIVRVDATQASLF